MFLQTLLSICDKNTREQQVESFSYYYLTVDKQVLWLLRASCGSYAIVLKMWANVRKNGTKVKGHLPSNPCCRGKLSPKLLLTKVTSSSLLRILDFRLHATILTQQQANRDSGSDRQWDPYTQLRAACARVDVTLLWLLKVRRLFSRSQLLALLDALAKNPSNLWTAKFYSVRSVQPNQNLRNTEASPSPPSTEKVWRHTHTRTTIMFSVIIKSSFSCI